MGDRAVRGLLFDKDGTLFDFNASWRVVVDQTIEVLAPSPAYVDRMALDVGYDRANRRFQPGSVVVAGAISECAAAWAKYRPDLGAERIETIANQIVDSAVTRGTLVPAVPDLRGVLRSLTDLGMQLGVATHDSEAAARSQIRLHGALDCFAFISGYDSGHGLKPGPGMMHAFCRATGLQPGECAMIGDSIHDLGVAPSAGAAMAIGVLTGPAERRDLEPHADHVIDSIGDLPDLLRRLA